MSRPLRDERPAIAIVSNSHTPYRLHLHRRIVAEVPEVQLFSLYTHQASNSDWTLEAPAEIGPVFFGQGEPSVAQDRLSKQPREWRRGGRIVRWLAEHRIRFVVMMGYNDLGRLRVMRWCRSHGVPCFLFGDSNIRGDRASGLTAAVKRRLLTRVLRWCDGVLVCGRLGEQYFARYGVPPQRTYLFPYEPDYGLIQDLSSDTLAAAARRFALPPDRRRIIYSGRLVDVKRVDLLIDAFVTVAAGRPMWDLLIVGDGPLRESLRARVPADISARVSWIGFLDDQRTVAALYRLSHVLVLPSDFEPWALVINEAVAAGLAVVSSDVVGAAAELVVDGVNGRLFSAGDAAQLADCLREVTTPDTLERMRAAAGGVLADWRRRGDPVGGLRSALRAAAVI